jgi:hypothetical protein
MLPAIVSQSALGPALRLAASAVARGALACSSSAAARGAPDASGAPGTPPSAAAGAPRRGLATAATSPSPAAPDAGPTKPLTLVAAVNEALHAALEADDTACCFGEDVSFGGVFRATVGLQERFGQARVFNTPLSEQARGPGGQVWAGWAARRRSAGRRRAHGPSADRSPPPPPALAPRRASWALASAWRRRARRRWRRYRQARGRVGRGDGARGVRRRGACACGRRSRPRPGNPGAPPPPPCSLLTTSTRRLTSWSTRPPRCGAAARARGGGAGALERDAAQLPAARGAPRRTSTLSPHCPPPATPSPHLPILAGTAAAGCLTAAASRCARRAARSATAATTTRSRQSPTSPRWGGCFLGGGLGLGSSVGGRGRVGLPDGSASHLPAGQAGLACPRSPRAPEPAAPLSPASHPNPQPPGARPQGRHALQPR